MKRKTLLAAVAILTAACGKTTDQLNQEVERLKGEARELDSVVNMEFIRIKQLDTLIQRELSKVHQLDSIIQIEKKKWMLP